MLKKFASGLLQAVVNKTMMERVIVELVYLETSFLTVFTHLILKMCILYLPVVGIVVTVIKCYFNTVQ